MFKFYLHLSKEEQRQRLLRRLEKEKHNWKFSLGDLKERGHWDEYQEYYEEAINKTSTKDAPWYIVPADDKGVARYIVAKTIWEKLQSLTDITEPELDPKVAENIDIIILSIDNVKIKDIESASKLLNSKSENQSVQMEMINKRGEIIRIII